MPDTPASPRPCATVPYRDDETNTCPGCGRSHWHVGRVTAECGFCGTALPREVDTSQPPRFTRIGSGGAGVGVPPIDPTLLRHLFDGPDSRLRRMVDRTRAEAA